MSPRALTLSSLGAALVALVFVLVRAPGAPPADGAAEPPQRSALDAGDPDQRADGDLPPHLRHSSMGGATGSATRDGKPLLASNGDNPWATRTRLLVVEPEGGYRFIGTQIVSPPEGRSPWSDMITRGMNERGLAYSWTYVAPRSEPDSRTAEGMTFEEFGRTVLGQAATVEEAIALVAGRPRAFHGNFLFADASGEMALVEISTRTFEVAVRFRDGVAFRSNHWLTPRMQELRAPPDALSDSGWRFARLTELFGANQGGITEQTLMRIFSDTHGAVEHGWSVESHRVPPDGGPSPSGTTSSDVSSPRDLVFWYAYGWGSGMAPRQPEVKGFQNRSWGVYVPFHLPDLEPGEYSTTDGRLTPLAVRYLMASSGLSVPTMELPPALGQSAATWERNR